MKHFSTFLLRKNAFSKCPFLLAAFLLTFAFPTDAWAGHGGPHYGKVTVTKTGEGSVYISTNQSATSGKTEETWNCGNDSSKDSKTYFLFATPDAAKHYYFEGWYLEGANKGIASPYTAKHSPSSTTNGTPTTFAYTAKFELLPKFYFAAGAAVDAAGNGTGKVAVAYSSKVPAEGNFSADPVSAKTNVWATAITDDSMTATAYYFAKADAGMTFMGWYDKDGVPKTTNTTYSVPQTSITKEDDATPEVYYARFRDPDIKFDPAVELAGQDGATEVTLKIEETQVVSFVNVDDVVLSTLNAPTINVVNRVDPGSDPIVIWDANAKTLTANRAGTATITFSHPETDGYNAGNFTFTIHVEKITPEFSWKTSALLDGQTYSLTDLVETPSDGAWNIVSSKESVFASISQAGTTSATAHMGSTTLTFSQGVSYKYNAVPAMSKEFKVYSSEGLATFSVNSQMYSTLDAAISAAKTSKKNIIVASDGAVLPGNYTIPSGITLIIPYNSSASAQTTPSVVTTAATLQAYRTLTLIDGVNITVNGSICVGGQLMSAAGGNPSSYPTGGVGVIDMSTGGHIDVNSGGTIYAWGFIRGQGYLDGNNTKNVGTITAKNNSLIREYYSVGDWGGGSLTKALNDAKSSFRVYPFQSYFVQNIEVPVRFEYGSKEQLYLNVYGGSRKNEADAIYFIGTQTGVLFYINSAQGAVTKWYDATTDHMVVELEGDTRLDNLKIVVMGYTINANEFDLPILNNMHIKLKNCDLTLSSPVMMQPSSIFEVTKGSSLTLNTNLFVYDADQWDKFVMGKYFRPVHTILTPHVGRGDGSTNTLSDAQLIVDGTLMIGPKGALYTTAGGADVMGHNGGHVIWNRSLPTSGKICGYNGGTAVNGNSLNASLKEEYKVTNTCDAGNLHNENGSYTASISSTTFDNLHGRWFTHAAATTLDANNMYTFTFIGGTSQCFYSPDKTGLTAGYKWVDLKESDTDHTCGSTMTFVGKDDNLYTFKNGEWLQLVQIAGGTTYSGSDDNLYQFLNCDWVSLGEIGDDCMYTVEGVKKAVVGSELVALEKDEYDEVYVKTTDHSDYYMLFDGCVWQHAEKVPDTYKAYSVLGNYYVWIDNTWTEVEQDGEFFYTTDDQGLKHYYEYNGDIFAWVPVKDKVMITTAAGDEMGFRNWDDAMLYVGQFNNPTVTLLADVATTSIFTITGSAKTTDITIDLNDHVLDANVGAQVTFLKLNNSKVTLTITDNSDHQRGELKVTCSVTKRVDAINVTVGKVVMEAGKVSIHNTSNSTSANASAIYAAAGQSVTMNGGELEAISTRYAYGINAASSAALASTSVVTVNGGTINATAKDYAYGIYSYGTVNLNGGTINATTTTVNGVAGANYAYGIYLNISVSAVDANSYHATLNMTGGTINATAATSSSYGIYANANYTSAWGKGDDNKTDNTKKPSDGTHSNKASARIDVSGGTINVTSLTSTAAYGIYKLGGENSYTDKSETGFSPDYIRNVKIDAKATANVYGIFITAAVGDFHAGKLIGKAVVENVDVRAEATLSTGAYAAYVSASNIWINRARFRNQSAANRKLWYVTAGAGDKDIEHGAIAATGGTNVYPYQIGSYAVGAELTINSGNFYAKTFTTSAYGVYVNRSASPYDNAEGLATCVINGGTFTAETTTDTGYSLSSGGNTTINGGTFNALTGTSTAYGIYTWAGTTTVNNCTVNATGTTSTAYAVAAGGTIDTNVGTHAHGTLIVKDGVFNARALNTSTAYGAYATATYAEMNRTKYDGRSASNKQQYFALKEDGTIDVHATSASATSGYFQDIYPYRYGQYTEGGVVHVYGGTFNVKTFTTIAVCAGATWSNMVRTTELGRLMVARGEMNVHGGIFTAETETGSTAECIRSYGTMNVDGGTFTATAATTTAYCVRTLDGTTTIDGGTFTAIAKDNTAYGVRAEYEFNTSYGYYGEGNIVVNDGTFNVNTWKGGTTYGVQVTGTNAAYTASSVTKDEAGNAIVKPANYACAGRVTINGGNFTMNPADGTNSYGVVASATQTRGTGDALVTAYPKAEVNGGFFKMLGKSTYAAGTSATEDAEGNPNIWIKGGHFSTKANLEQASPKNYVRDPYTIIPCVHPDYKNDYPFEVAEVCTITFKDDEGNTLWSGFQPKGTMAVYPLTNGIPEKTATADNSFEFASWDTPLATITGDATYTASFNTVAKKYMVTWQDENGNEIDHLEWASGQTPTHADPVKEGYTFTGWTPSITAVAGAAQTYKATFQINTYTIRFVDEDGTLLKEQVVNHGIKPTAPANPTKDGYSFQTWNPGVVVATEDVTYQASYLLNIASVTDASTSKTTNYTSWSGAVTAANKLTSGGTLTLLTDMYGQGAQTLTKSMTIDLNGHILSGTATKLIQVNAAGINVRMIDSQGGGQLRVSAAAASELDAVYVNNGTFTLESGTIYCENVHATANDNYRGVGVYVVAGKDFVMTGGRVEGYNQQCNYAIYGMGRVNISGGEVVSTARTKARGLYLTENSTLDNVDVLATATTTENAVAVMVANSKTPTVTINGGHYKAVAKTTNACALNGYTTNTINVNGGEFEAEAPTAAYGIKFQVKTSAINFNAGKIKATTAPVDNVAPATMMKFYGGYFDKDVNLATYVVSPKKVVTLNPTSDATELAEGYTYKIVDNAYQITFCDEDGTVLQQGNVEAGVQPVFMGEEPTKPSNPKTSYEFAGWSDGVHTYAAAEIPVANAAATYTAVFIEHGVEYPITFYNIDGKGGTYVQMVEYGTVPVYDGPAPFSSGNIDNVAYIFNGWSPTLAEVTEPTTYEATFRLEIAVDVTFHANGRGADPVALKVAKGAAIERPADQLVDCQHIEGWYTEAGCINEWNFASDLADETDIDLYAKWATKTYTITWLDEFGDEIDQTIVNCNEVPTHANLYKPSTALYSYEFRGWNKAIVAANENATYKSLGFNQIAKRYAITFVTGSGATVINPIEQEVGTPITAPANPTKTGYTFAGWDKDIPATMPAENMTITATWTANTYTVRFDGNNATSGSMSDQTFIYDEAAKALTTNGFTKTGYTFAGWATSAGGEVAYRNGESVTNLSSTQGATVTLYAQWTPVESGDYLDIVDWTSNSLTINMNGSSQKITIGTTTKNKNDRETNRTMVFSGLSLAPGDDVLIAARNNTTDALESFHTYKVPYIYTGTDINPGTTGEVWVKSGTWTVSGDKTIAKLVVCPGADVKITSGTLTVSGKLVLRTTPWESAAISGEFAADQTYYTRIIEKNDAYYHFGLPLACNIDNVRLSNGKTVKYGTSWVLHSYNGANRAVNGADGNNWTPLTGTTPETKVIAANTGYEMFSNSNYYCEYYFPVNPDDLTATTLTAKAYISEIGSAHQGWNVLVAPKMGNWSIYTGGDSPEDFAKICRLVDLNVYEQCIAEDIRPAIPFYYQNLTAADETLHFEPIAKAIAARRSEAGEAVQTQWLRLYYFNEQGTKDETNIYLNSDKFTSAYEVGYDVTKMSTSGSRPLIYTQLPCGDLAFTALPDEALIKQIPLTVYSPTSGDYTFSMKQNRYLTRMKNVWILDVEEGALVDLMQNDYTTQVGEGTTAERFYLLGKFRAPQTPTDLEELGSEDYLNNQGNADVPRKVIYDEHMYILYHNHIWDANGRLIK